MDDQLSNEIIPSLKCLSHHHHDLYNHLLKEWSKSVFNSILHKDWSLWIFSQYCCILDHGKIKSSKRTSEGYGCLAEKLFSFMVHLFFNEWNHHNNNNNEPTILFCNIWRHQLCRRIWIYRSDYPLSIIFSIEHWICHDILFVFFKGTNRKLSTNIFI